MRTEFELHDKVRIIDGDYAVPTREDDRKFQVIDVVADTTIDDTDIIFYTLQNLATLEQLDYMVQGWEIEQVL